MVATQAIKYALQPCDPVPTFLSYPDRADNESVNKSRNENETRSHHETFSHLEKKAHFLPLRDDEISVSSVVGCYHQGGQSRFVRMHDDEISMSSAAQACFLYLPDKKHVRSLLSTENKFDSGDRDYETDDESISVSSVEFLCNNFEVEGQQTAGCKAPANVPEFIIYSFSSEDDLFGGLV